MNLKSLNLNNEIIIFICFLMVFILSCILYITQPYESYEAVISSARILLTFMFFWAAYKFNLTPSTVNVMKFLFYLGLINSLLVILQLSESTLKLIDLPDALKYGFLYDYPLYAIEPFRQGGLANSLQISSALGLLSVIYASRFYSVSAVIFVAIICAPSIIFGSRTVIIIAILASLTANRKMIISFLVVISILFYFYFTWEDLFNFINFRYSFFYTGSDYSAIDTISHYSIPENLITGNNCERYSNCGGRDPLVSRWLMQVGVFTTFFILLGIILILLNILSNLPYKYGYLILIAVLFLDFKGEYSTSSAGFLALSYFYFALKRTGYEK